MRFPSKRYVASSLFWFLALYFSIYSVRAQDGGEDRRNATSFIDSVAKTVYNLAWPTATYREVHLDGFEPADGGFDVTVKISGQSAFDDSDLWVKLAFMFRNGKLYDIRVQDHNAILVPPFVTTTQMAKVAANLAKEYADEQKAQEAKNAPPPYAAPAPPSYSAPYAPPQATPNDSPVIIPAETPTPVSDDPNAPTAEGTCLHNPTTHEIVYEYRWGDGPWKQDKLEPNRQMEHWWKYLGAERSSPQLTIRYEDDSVNPEALRVYNLDRTPTVQPPSCEALSNYQFRMDGPTTLIYTGAP